MTFGGDLHPTVFGLILVGAGGIGIVSAVVWRRKAAALKRRGIQANATVINKRVEMRSRKGSRDVPWYWVMVRWEDAAGRERTAKRVVSRVYDSVSVGAKTPIIYLPQEPDDATEPDFAFVDEPSLDGLMIGCLLMFSLAFLAIGIAAILSSSGSAGT